MKTNYLLLLVIVLMSSCATQSITTIVGCSYNKKKDLTDYLVFPIGSVSLPGEWIKTNYNSSSRQQFFKNSDDITIAIGFGICNRYEFNLDNSKEGFDFVNAYYEWEAEYMAETYQLAYEKIEVSEENNYILWRVFGDYEGEPWENYFLFGEKRGAVSNFSVYTTDLWSAEEKIAFLKELYLGREKTDKEEQQKKNK